MKKSVLALLLSSAPLFAAGGAITEYTQMIQIPSDIEAQLEPDMSCDEVLTRVTKSNVAPGLLTFYYLEFGKSSGEWLLGSIKTWRFAEEMNSMPGTFLFEKQPGIERSYEIDGDSIYIKYVNDNSCVANGVSTPSKNLSIFTMESCGRQPTQNVYYVCNERFIEESD